MNQTISKILLSPVFLISLFLLLFNDFFLKSHFHNFLTGKLSDFAGLFVFSLFWIAFFPKRKLFILISIGLFFVYWKSPYSQSLINFWNSLEFFSISRVIDYSDLTALFILPIAYFYSLRQKAKSNNYSPFKKAVVNCIVLLSLFAFMATSSADEHSFFINKRYELNITRPEFEILIRENPEIKEIIIERGGEKSNSNWKPYESWVDFSLNHLICDTNYPKVSFIIIDYGNQTIINGFSMHVRCKEFADRNTNISIKKYEPIITNIFESEVIDRLKHNSPH